MAERYTRTVEREFTDDALRRFAYVEGYLGPELAWGDAWPRPWKGPRFWAYDVHRSRRECNTYTELNAIVEDPTFDVESIYGTFMLIQKTAGAPIIEVTIRVRRASDGDRRQWWLKAEIDGTHQAQVVGARSQAELIIDRAIEMSAEELKEHTAFLFEEPKKGPVRAFFGRIVEGVISNLLASTVIAVFSFVAGVVIGRAA
jgi:hypothetical protein